jgi:galactose mutarotase-like enzyme
LTEKGTSYRIANDIIDARISSLGAELQSLRDLTSAEEFIWQGDPDIWSGRAPVLFPVVGALRDDNYEHGGQRYTLPKHGFARRRQFAVTAQSADAITFTLREDEDSLRQFPWPFELQVAFRLRDRALRVDYRVLNRSDDTMFFNLGSHPAFQLPLGSDRHEDYSIVFDQQETLDCWLLGENLLHECIPDYLSKSQQLDLTRQLFDKDALVFRNIASRTLGIEHRKRGRRLSVDTGGAPHLGIWAKPGAAFVCIEPWWGYADFTEGPPEIAQKPSIQALAAGRTFETYIEISLAC